MIPMGDISKFFEQRGMTQKIIHASSMLQLNSENKWVDVYRLQENMEI